MIGIEHTFKVHADANGSVVFDSFVRREFSHDETRADIKKAVSIDDHGLQAFVVQISYPEGKEPALGEQTVSGLFHDALEAIEAAIEVGAARGKAPKAVKVVKAEKPVEAAKKEAKAKPVAVKEASPVETVNTTLAGVEASKPVETTEPAVEATPEEKI